MIKTKMNYSKEAFNDFAKYSIKTSGTMKIIYICAVLILACSVVLLVLGNIAEGILYGCLGLIFAFYAPLMRLIINLNNKRNIGTVDEYEFDEDRFSIVSKDANNVEVSTSTLIYSRLFKVKKHINYGYIYVNKAIAYIVRKEDFENEDDFDFVLDRIADAIKYNKKHKGTTPAVFGSQNVTPPTEEGEQDLGEPTPPPMLNEYGEIVEEEKEEPADEEDLENTEEGEEGEESLADESAENLEEDEVSLVNNEETEIEEEVENVDPLAEEDNNEFADEQPEEVVRKDNQETEEETVIPADIDDDDDNDAPAEQTMQDEEAFVQPEVTEEETSEEEPEEVADTTVEDQIELVEQQINLVEEQINPMEETAQAEEIDEAEELEEVVDEQPEVEPIYADAPVTQPLYEEIPVAEDPYAEFEAQEENQPEKVVEAPVADLEEENFKDVKVEPLQEESESVVTPVETEEQPKKKRGRPAKKANEVKENKPKGKRGRPPKKDSEKKSTAKKKAEDNKPKGKRGRPPKKATAEAEKKPRKKRATSKKVAQEPVVETPVQDVAPVVQPVQETPVQPVVQPQPAQPQVEPEYTYVAPAQGQLVEDDYEEEVAVAPAVVEPVAQPVQPQPEIEEEPIAEIPDVDEPNVQPEVEEPVGNNETFTVSSFDDEMGNTQLQQVEEDDYVEPASIPDVDENINAIVEDLDNMPQVNQFSNQAEEGPASYVVTNEGFPEDIDDDDENTRQ